MGPSRPSWQRERDFQFAQWQVLLYWTDTANQQRHTNRLYHRMRILAAQRRKSLGNGECCLEPGYDRVPRADRLRRYISTVLPSGVRFRCNGDDGLGLLGKISARTATGGRHIVRFLDDSWPINLPLPPVRCATSTGAVPGC